MSYNSLGKKHMLGQEVFKFFSTDDLYVYFVSLTKQIVVNTIILKGNLLICPIKKGRLEECIICKISENILKQCVESVMLSVILINNNYFHVACRILTFSLMTFFWCIHPEYSCLISHAGICEEGYHFHVCVILFHTRHCLDIHITNSQHWAK